MKPGQVGTFIPVGTGELERANTLAAWLPEPGLPEPGLPEPWLQEPWLQEPWLQEPWLQEPWLQERWLEAPNSSSKKTQETLQTRASALFKIPTLSLAIGRSHAVAVQGQTLSLDTNNAHIPPWLITSGIPPFAEAPRQKQAPLAEEQTLPLDADIAHIPERLITSGIPDSAAAPWQDHRAKRPRYS